MKKRQRVPGVVKFALFCFALYATVSLVHLQLQISDKSARLEDLNAQIQSQTAKNSEIKDSLDQGASDENIATIARDKLGYASPGERVFVDASSK
ncbi:FtsB family cell division protein [Intestinibacillus massiliensis]|uniref:FtsB family cell division protein n=1 Tax=Intestinibacillus massiliensis TaxID=1871029 RepID=UPI001356641D|nr:septum formation initiator family protein [Intestinibacillus massiliensis]